MGTILPGTLIIIAAIVATETFTAGADYVTAFALVVMACGGVLFAHSFERR